SRWDDDSQADEIGHAVGGHDVDRPPRQQHEDQVGDLLLAQVTLDDLHALHRHHRQHDARDHPPCATHSAARVLAPGARRRSEIEAQLAGLEQLLAPIDLLQLEHGSRAPALGPCALHERIREMFLQPSAAAFLTPALDFRLARRFWRWLRYLYNRMVKK